MKSLHNFPRPLFGNIWLLFAAVPLVFTSCDNDEYLALIPEPEPNIVLTDQQRLEMGPFNLLNPKLISVIKGEGPIANPSGEFLLDSLQGLNMLRQYAAREAERGGLIQPQTAETIYNLPELHAKKHFNVDGLGIDSNPHRNTDLIMNAAAVAAHSGAETMRDFLFSKTPQGLPKVAGIVYSNSLSETANAMVLHNPQTDQILIMFKEPYSHEMEKFLIMSVMAHELVHQDAAVSQNEERAANTLEHLLMLNQVLRHPELYANSKQQLMSSLEFNQISQQIAFLNSLSGHKLDLIGANRHVYPNAVGNTSLSQVKSLTEHMDLQMRNSGTENDKILSPLASVEELRKVPIGWVITSIHTEHGCFHPGHGHNLRTMEDAMPDGGYSPSNPSLDDFMSRAFGLETGGSKMSFTDEKYRVISSSIKQHSGNQSIKNPLSPANRLRAMEIIGLDVPSKYGN